MAFWHLNKAAFIAAVRAMFHVHFGGISPGHINGSDLEESNVIERCFVQVFTIWLAVSAGVLVCVSLDASLGLMAIPSLQ